MDSHAAAILEKSRTGNMDELMQQDQEEYKKRLAEEAVRKEAQRKEQAKMSFKRDNLKFITMAKYKALKDADILQYELVEKRLTSVASNKGLALSSSTMYEYEKKKEGANFETGEEIQVDRKTEDGKNHKEEPPTNFALKKFHMKGQSEDGLSEKNSMIKSDFNYWEDIQPKMNEYAQFLDFT